MLFGRRKPGFAKEVELRPEDISDEFSDRNDPARQDANPKVEKTEMGERAQAVIDGTARPAEQAQEGKVDLFDYMDSLPEEADPFPPSENPMIEDPNAEPEMVEMKPGEMLAEFIRERTRSVNLTPKKELAKEEPLLDEMIEEMRNLENCQDIRSVVGEKDEYFYSIDIMAKNYAMIAMLVYEKDLPRTLATMTRHNCKVYPSPTPLYYFTRHPFSYTKPQLDFALKKLQEREEFADIKTLTTWNGVLYLYAEGIMSKKYAQALADDGETSEADRR